MGLLVPEAGAIDAVGEIWIWIYCKLKERWLCQVGGKLSRNELKKVKSGSGEVTCS